MMEQQPVAVRGDNDDRREAAQPRVIGLVVCAGVWKRHRSPIQRFHSPP